MGFMGNGRVGKILAIVGKCSSNFMHKEPHQARPAKTRPPPRQGPLDQRDTSEDPEQESSDECGAQLTYVSHLPWERSLGHPHFGHHRHVVGAGRGGTARECRRKTKSCY